MFIRGPCIDLFCGAGGLSCGFMEAGFEIGAGVDVDTAALVTFQNNHPFALPIRADVTELTAEKLGKLVGNKAIFGLLGGPPCQGFSVAGKNDPNDIRNQLPYEYARLLKEIQPCFFLMENVKGMLGKKQRVHFEAILELFSEAGYNLEWKLLNAWDYGVAQTRQRVFIIGFRNDLNISFRWPDMDPSKPVLKDVIGDIPEPAAADETIPNHGPIPADPENILRLVSQADANGIIPLDVLQLAMPTRVEWLKGRQKVGSWHKPNPTITATTSFFTGAHFHPNVAKPRRFTVRECARIQSFADSFVFYGSLSAQYRQVGNAVPPKLAFYLAQSIAAAFENMK